MATLSWPAKDPDEILDYEIDWSARIGATDSISTSTWSVDPGLMEIGGTLNAGLHITAIWLGGGTEGTSYSITNTVITSEGRKLQQTVKLKVKSK